jgi:PAS domain S-box-containing protein
VKDMTGTLPTEVWRVVVVDDSPDDRAEIRQMLLLGSARPLTFTEAGTASDGLRAIAEAGPGLTTCAIIDFHLPDLDAPEVIAELTGADGETPCPIVVLTGTVGSSTSQAVLRAGAQDYIAKQSLTSVGLARAVENAVERWRMTRELQAQTQRLRTSEERLRLALEASDTGLWDWDVRTDAVSWSPECYRIHGLREGEFAGTGEAFYRMVHDQDRDRVDRAARTAIDNRTLYESEFRLVHPDGTIVWVANRGRATYDATGLPVRMLGTITDITRRKRSEARSQWSADAFRHLIERSPFGVYTVDADFRIAQVSEGARKTFANVQPVIGRDFSEVMRILWPEPSASDFIGLFRRTLETGEPYQCPSLVEVRADLHEVEAYDWRIERVTLPDGRDGVVCHFYDLSERQRFEAALAMREQELQTLADNSPDILTRFDAPLRHLFVNAAVEAATGRPKADFIGRTNRELGMPPERFGQWDAALRSVFESGQPASLEFRFDSPSGARQYSARVVPEYGPDGRVASVLGVTRDVTDSRVAEAAVRASEERFRALVTATSDVVYRMTPDWSELRSLDGRDFIPSTTEPTRVWLDKYVLAEDQARVCAVIEAAVRSKGLFEVEHRVRRMDGTEGWAFSRAVPILGEDGEIAEWFGAARDVTRRKEAEWSLREADRRKDEFLATLAHELRNPLATLRNGLAILALQGAEAGGRGERTVTMMARQLGQLVELVDDLLDVSRVGQGKITLRTERLLVREVIDAAIEGCLPTVEARAHRIAVEVEDPPRLSVQGDRTRMVQVLSNLLINAAKYTDPGGQITVSGRRDGSLVVLAVTDSGIGIAPEALPTIWNMFSQVRDSLGNAQGGLGIGLSLVKKLVELHGGSVAAESAGLGRGSSFTIRLPQSTDERPAIASPQADRIEPPAIGRRVLVVDDNLDGAESLSHMLGLLGHVTEMVHDGPAALDAVGGFRPEIVLLDIGLPGMDGYEVAHRLRAEPGTAEVILVALTGWGSGDDRRRTREAGFDHHLTKPVAPDELRRVLGSGLRAGST